MKLIISSLLWTNKKLNAVKFSVLHLRVVHNDNIKMSSVKSSLNGSHSCWYHNLEFDYMVCPGNYLFTRKYSLLFVGIFYIVALKKDTKTIKQEVWVYFTMVIIQRDESLFVGPESMNPEKTSVSSWLISMSPQTVHINVVLYLIYSLTSAKENCFIELFALEMYLLPDNIYVRCR